jgi:hypothetical protein
MSRWEEFLRQRREHRDIRSKLESDDFDLE